MSLRGNPDELARLSAKATEIFNERFDSKVMTAKVEKIYRDLLSQINPAQKTDDERPEVKN